MPRSTVFPEEEVQWILRCQSGDTTAFRSLVEKYEGKAFWIVYHMVGHVDDAQDIVQEAFIRVWGAIPRFRVEKRFFTWFYQILLHLSIDCLRKRREKVDLEAEGKDNLEDLGSDPAQRFLQGEAAERIQRLLLKLSPRDRAILILRDIEGISAKEIAEITRTNHSTVRWWLFLARKEFRREWENLYGKEDPCN